MGDYHIHLHPHEPRRSGDVEPGTYPAGHIEGYVEAAASRGVTELGFTEHLYRCVDAAGVLGPFWEWEPDERLAAQTREFVGEDCNLSLENYVEAVVGAKDRGLPIKLGLEVDFFPETIDAVIEFLSAYPFDFLIGAVHWVGGWSVDHSGAVFEFERRGVGPAYEDYFALETALAASGTVDVLAHSDVVKKYGHRPAEPPVHLYDQVVEAASATGVAVEVSSAGLYQPAAEIYPAPLLLRMFHDAGVPITLASDAHYPSEAARGHDDVVAAARAAGYENRVKFSARRSTVVPM